MIRPSLRERRGAWTRSQSWLSAILAVAKSNPQIICLKLGQSDKEPKVGVKNH